MPEVAALEEHLRARPHDAGSWLVYGDWLLEQGDARGELVRLDAATVEARVEEHRTAWRGCIPAKAITEWRYGFPIALELPLDARTPGSLHGILRDPNARLIRSLGFHRFRYFEDEELHLGPPVEDGVDVFLALVANDLSQIRALAFDQCELFDLEKLLTKARLGPLDSLDLRYSALGDAGAEMLAASPILAGVRTLRLHANDISDAGARALAASPHVGALELLDIRYNPIGNVEFAAKRVLRDRPPSVTRAPQLGVERATKTIAGLTLSPVATDRFTAARFVTDVDGDFERPSVDLPHVAKAYVDPNEWSFASFENIVPLDALADATLAMTLDYTDDIAVDIHRMTLVPSPATRALLDKLDTLPLYTRPLNAVTRGGLRYIFHSAKLADALTTAVRDALPLEHFSHVNPVFRCNRFEPGDDRFHPHVDTPYFDAVHHHVSKYTLLIYLTGGTGEPALRFDDRALATIAPLTCLAMHQRHPHDGGPYREGRKVFLRTELVFEDTTLTCAPAIGHTFAKATYFTSESITTPVLARDADDAYNRVARAHWSGALEAATEPFVHKRFRDVHWLANGYDFWFPRALSPVECAAVTLLDYFNAKVGGEPFRSQCATEVVRDVDPDDFVAGFAAPDAPFATIDKALLFPPPEADTTCCPQHTGDRYDPTRSHDVIELYASAQEFARSRLEPAPILMLGNEVILDPSKFVVDGDKIHVLSAQRLAPVNFASCWNCPSRPPNFVDVAATFGVLQPLVPPILWEATRETHHLMFDFFRNAWAVSHAEYQVPVPHVRRVHAREVNEDDEAWLAAAERTKLAKGGESGRAPWWAYYAQSSALIRELFRKR